MKFLAPSLSLVLGLLLAVPSLASAQTQVGVSVQVQKPGVYGRIDIGGLPPPPVVYANPVVIAQPAVVVPAQPLYLYVPPGHQKKWSKHCHRYNACGQPVYFVKESWVRERYEHEHPRGGRHDRRGGPVPREAHGPGHGGPGHGGHKGRGHGHDH